MSIDYKQLQEMVREAMYTGGGFADGAAPTSFGAIMGPSAPEGVPHRMPAADTADKEQEMGDPQANKMYNVALAAREATEDLVEALDDPLFDEAYEYAFKASANLRKVLNSIESSGAHPMPDQRVVAPPAGQQKYTGGSDYAGGAIGGAMIEADEPDVAQATGGVNKK